MANSRGMTHPRKVAGFRLPGYGNRTWSYPVYTIPGVSPSVSYYDVNEAVIPTNMTDSHENGLYVPENVPPVMDTRPRIGATFSSLPAGRIWQSGWKTRWTGTEWAGMIARLSDSDRQLNTNFNPLAPGSKEQQRATVYDPWPSAGALYPKAV
jgi:hypothetical protein